MKKVNHRARVSSVERVLSGVSLNQIATEYSIATDEVQQWLELYKEGGHRALRDRFTPIGKRKHAAPDPWITTVADALAYAADKRDSTYGRFLSDALAVVVANGLRARGFDGILPDKSGGFESRSRSSKGFKKLDVNYSTIEMGLGLGVSIKTISKRDQGTSRYTKNYSRNDNELRAEAMDYHQRQPYSVLVGMLFLPLDSADDAGEEGDEGERGTSSFGAAVRYFRDRSNRTSPQMPADLFEGFFVVAYDSLGEAFFYDVMRPGPPRDRRPTRQEAGTLDRALDAIRDLYDERNNPKFTWG
jgi:hypothetical protein